MAIIEYRKPWTRQPQGERQLSSFARSVGIEAVILPFNYTSAVLRQNGGAGTVSKGFGQYGNRRIYSSSSEFYTDGGKLYPGDGYFWVWVGNWTSIGTWGGLIARTSDDSTAQGWAWQKSSTTDNLVVYHGANSRIIGSISAILSSTPAVWIGAWDRRRAYLYRNGQLVYISIDFPELPAYTAGAGQIKLAASRDVSVTSGSCYLCALSVLHTPTLETISRISQNPWQIFEPRRIFVPVTAAGALPTLSNARGLSVTASGFQPAVDYTY